MLPWRVTSAGAFDTARTWAEPSRPLTGACHNPHTMTVSWAVRAVRAAVFAAVCVALAVAGHGLAAGAAPRL